MKPLYYYLVGGLGLGATTMAYYAWRSKPICRRELILDMELASMGNNAADRLEWKQSYLNNCSFLKILYSKLTRPSWNIYNSHMCQLHGFVNDDTVFVEITADRVAGQIKVVHVKDAKKMQRTWDTVGLSEENLAWEQVQNWVLHGE
jgi:hypothetical protein